MGKEFNHIVQEAARDYCLDLDTVQEIYDEYGGTGAFYDALEEELENRRKRNNRRE